MDAIDKALAAFNQGNLSDAIEACNDGLRSDPMNQEIRVYLCQFLCFDGNWSRIEKMSEHVLTRAGDDRGKFFFGTVLRQLINGEKLRAQVWNEGHVPGLLTEKDDTIEAYLKLWTLNREARLDEARELLETRIDNLPTVSAKSGGTSIDALTDLDEMTRHLFEVIIPNGGYFWLPIAKVKKLELSAPTRPMDQYWRQANVTLRDDRSMYVYIPVTYFESFRDESQDLKLGRATRWDEKTSNLDRAIGRRIFSIGNGKEMCAMELQTIEFDVLKLGD